MCESGPPEKVIEPECAERRERVGGGGGARGGWYAKYFCTLSVRELGLRLKYVNASCHILPSNELAGASDEERCACVCVWGHVANGKGWGGRREEGDLRGHSAPAARSCYVQKVYILWGEGGGRVCTVVQSTAPLKVFMGLRNLV